MRDINQIIETCQAVFTQIKQSYNPGYTLSDKARRKDHWTILANNIIETDADIYDYIYTAFERIINPEKTDAWVLSREDTKQLYLLKKQEKKITAKKALRLMEGLYQHRVDKGFTKPKILLDMSLYFNPVFRYCKALDENLFEVAKEFEQATIDFLKENNEYVRLLRDKLPEGILCQL